MYPYCLGVTAHYGCMTEILNTFGIRISEFCIVESYIHIMFHKMYTVQGT